MHIDQGTDPASLTTHTQLESNVTTRNVEAYASARELLRQGILLAKEGDKGRGRELLLEAVNLEPRSEMAWLWLASVAETPEDGVSCLQRVLDINPAHEQALQWMKQARRNLAQSLLAQGVAAAKAGDAETARTVLARALEHDASREVGWLWLASVTEAPEEKLMLLERALAINPSNAQTQTSIQRTQASVARALVQQAVNAVNNDERERARELVERAYQLDAQFEDAWLLSARLTDDLTERASHLRRALEINPTSMRARTMLEATESEIAAADEAADAELHAPNYETLTDNETTTAEVEQPSVEQPSIAQPASAESITAVESIAATDSTAATAEPIAAAPSFTIAPPQAVSRTILVVDDSPTVRKLITIKLEKEGHRVVPAVDGKDALAKLNDVVPDLIFTDITMPRMDGYQFCKLVRSDETTKHVPIIMLSGKDGFFDKVRGRMAGSTAYITKPFEPETLLKVVNDHCREASGN